MWAIGYRNAVGYESECVKFEFNNILSLYTYEKLF